MPSLQYLEQFLLLQACLAIPGVFNGKQLAASCTIIHFRRNDQLMRPEPTEAIPIGCLRVADHLFCASEQFVIGQHRIRSATGDV